MKRCEVSDKTALTGRYSNFINMVLVSLLNSYTSYVRSYRRWYAAKKKYQQFRIHTVLVSRSLILSLFYLTHFANLHHFLICALSLFRFNALCLAAFYYANPSFPIGMSFFITPYHLHPLFKIAT
jgi:hypothetical protein